MAALGEKNKGMVVAKASYAVTDPTVTSQIISLKSAGADTFVLFAQSRAAAQAISVARDQAGPDAMIFVPYVASAKSVLGAVGDDKLKGVLSTDTVKDTTDPAWDNDQGVKDYIALIEKYVPESDRVTDRIDRRRLYGGAGDGRGAAPRRRRSDPRQHHEDRVAHR